MHTTITPDWQRLAKEVLARRLELGLRQKDVAERGGPSHLSVRLIEQAAQSSYRGLTLSKLDTALGWQPGTAQAIADGTAGDDPREWLRTDVTGADDRVPAVSKSQARATAVGALLRYAEALNSPEETMQRRAVLAFARQLNTDPTDWSHHPFAARNSDGL